MSHLEQVAAQFATVWSIKMQPEIWVHLPNDILYKILEQLPILTLAHLACTSKECRRIYKKVLECRQEALKRILFDFSGGHASPAQKTCTYAAVQRFLFKQSVFPPGFQGIPKTVRILFLPFRYRVQGCLPVPVSGTQGVSLEIRERVNALGVLILFVDLITTAILLHAILACLAMSRLTMRSTRGPATRFGYVEAVCGHGRETKVILP